jgi:hypothetical protein
VPSPGLPDLEAGGKNTLKGVQRSLSITCKLISLSMTMLKVCKYSTSPLDKSFSVLIPLIFQNMHRSSRWVKISYGGVAQDKVTSLRDIWGLRENLRCDAWVGLVLLALEGNPFATGGSRNMARGYPLLGWQPVRFVLPGSGSMRHYWQSLDARGSASRGCSCPAPRRLSVSYAKGLPG